MASKVDLCNMALAKIRSQSINSLTESSLQAELCSLFYETTLDFITEDTPWSFTKKQVSLSLLEDELFTWVYAYQYPSDCLVINRVMSATERLSNSSDGNAIRPQYYNDNPLNDYLSRITPVKYEILNSDNNKVIGANEPDLWIEYQIRVDDPNKYNSHFKTAFSWYLASELAVPIIGGDSGRKVRADALTMYSKTINSAVSLNANERYKGSERESDLILVRS